MVGVEAEEPDIEIEHSCQNMAHIHSCRYDTT